MPTLVLDGVPLQKEDVLAFVHFGHSNMMGVATDPPELRPYFFTETHPHVWMYHLGMPPMLATEPTAREDRIQRAGPGFALLKQAAERAPDKYFMSLGYAKDGATCLLFAPGGVYHDGLIESVAAIKDRVTFAAIVAMIGIVERRNQGYPPSSIPECLLAITDSIRTLVGDPNLPLLFSGYEVEAMGMHAPTTEGSQQVIAALDRVPDVVSNSAIVPADGVPLQDSHHFNLTGHMIWTKRVLDIMQEKGWSPWATSPASPDNP